LESTQSGAWNVGIAGTPNFNLVTPVTPIPVTTPGKVLVQASVAQNSPGNTCCVSGTLFHNGSTKTLVIEFVSMLAETSVGANGGALVNITTTVNGNVVAHHPLAASIMSGSLGVGSAGAPLRLYADPNSGVFYEIRRGDDTGNVNYLISMSGYQTDAP
jgi:hypothetical protein